MSKMKVEPLTSYTVARIQKEYNAGNTFVGGMITSVNRAIDENNDIIPDYAVYNPDFNFYQFRSNLVARWEYRLGSFIYLVWSSEWTGRNIYSDESFGDSYNLLRDVFSDNIFLIKVNYWFSL